MAEKCKEIMSKTHSSVDLKYWELKPELVTESSGKDSSTDLEETYNITHSNQKVQHHHEMYDLHIIMKVGMYDPSNPYYIPL